MLNTTRYSSLQSRFPSGKKAIFVFCFLLLVQCTLYIDNCMCQIWAPLGSGTSGTVYALTVYNNELIVGGTFTTAGGVTVNRIAKWDGTNWAPLGTGMNNAVRTLTVYNNELIVGGSFTTAGGVTVNRIAKWNGTNWAPIGTGMNSYVLALTVYNNELIAGGYFTTAGGVSANYIAKWNGTNWSPLGSGMTGEEDYIWTLTVYNNELVAGGIFNSAGGVSAKNIAKWNGSVWSPLGSGINMDVLALHIYKNELIAGGSFTIAGGVSAASIAKWNGTNWSPLGTGLGEEPYVFALTTYPNQNGELIAGGFFWSASGENIAKWNGYSWSSLGSGMNSEVWSLTVYPSLLGNIIAGGSFTNADGVSANRIAKSLYNTVCGKNNDKVLICHKGNTICISPDAVSDHLAHGDYLGPCTEGTDNITYSAPDKFVLYDNYPNPFNPVTRIKFDLPGNAVTKLVVYDILGRTVSVLVDGYLDAGTHIIDWDGSEFPSGVYFYRITANSFRETKKMFMMK